MGDLPVTAAILPLFGGILFTGQAVIGLFFFRFWLTSRDRLFAMFAVAFWLLAIQRLLLALTQTFFEDQVVFYLLRLFAFVVILVAIIDKNRR